MLEGNMEKRKKILLLALSILLIAGSTVAVLLVVTGFFTPKNETPGEGVVGVIRNNWDTGLADAESRAETSGTEKKGTQIPGYSSAEMNAGDRVLKISIGNPKDNAVGMYATLKLSDGTVLYESPLLHPGEGLTEVPLKKTLEKGSYDAMVLYQCVQLSDGKTPLNAAESGFTLTVH